ncbi:MAG TPA: protein kinase [Pyrinomonadaceae bacterium]|nr:protein kinase [Pyrinomonadaceae bacterium]
MNSETKVGNYVLEERIGRGGMGVVYRGRHTTLPRVVAIKSIDARTTRDLRRLRHRFEREAYIQSQLDHPSIVKIFDYVVGAHTYHIIMELVEGRSLAELLDAREGRPLPLERALDLFEQILEAVAYAHNFNYRDESGAERRGIIHRDLKPANILVGRDDRVKITDFGIVKLVGGVDNSFDTSGLAYGSPHYVSPEQAEGEHVDQRADIYSLGVILYEMLTGALPFGDGPGGKRMTRTEILRAHAERPPRRPTELNPSLSPEIEASILCALEKKPEHRFSSAVEFLRSVRRARGRDTGDLDEKFAPGRVRGRESDDTGRITGVTAEVARDTYTTQPIGAHICESCGAEVGEGETRCRACGLDLSASPATRDLLSGRTTRRFGSRGHWAVVVILAAGLLTAALIFFVRRAVAPQTGVGGEAGNVSLPSTNVATPTPGATRNANAAPGADAALLKPSRVSVDSSYDGYDTRPLADGVTDVRQIGRMRYNQGNWVSAETSAPHWIRLDFERPARVTTVYVYWGFDRDRYMPSRRVQLQALDGGEWKRIAELEPGANFDRAAFDFAPVETRGLRLFQEGQQGPTNRPFVMWVREVEVYGTGGQPAHR